MTEKEQEVRVDTQAKAKTFFGTFNVLKNDYIGKKFISGKHYEHAKINYVLKHLQPGDTVVDIGASYGVHTIPYAKTVGSEGTVYCFEPQKVLYTLLNDNIKMNVPEHKVYSFNIAIGDENRERVTLNSRTEGLPVNYKGTRKQYNFGGVNLGSGGESTSMRTLDSFDIQNVKLIKIDVEGAEPIVIWGAKKTIEKFLPFIYYERNNKRITASMKKMLKLTDLVANFDIKKYLSNLGYTFAGSGCMILAIPPINEKTS